MRSADKTLSMHLQLLEQQQQEVKLNTSTTKHIIRATTWRSGSTFLSEVLNSVPATYHHYEPFMEFGFADLNDPTLNSYVQKMTRDLLTCQYDQLADYVEFCKTRKEMFSRNVNLWKVCTPVKLALCYDAQFLSQLCPKFPIQIIKTVRLPMQNLADLLMYSDDDRDVRVIFLVRDPRGTMSSRKNMKWCNKPACSR